MLKVEFPVHLVRPDLCASGSFVEVPLISYSMPLGVLRLFGVVFVKFVVPLVKFNSCFSAVPLTGFLGVDMSLGATLICTICSS